MDSAKITQVIDKIKNWSLKWIVYERSKKTRNMFIDFSPVPECRNKDSYGTICTRCNRCGRFNVKLRNGRKL